MDKFKVKGLLILAVLIVGVVFAVPSFMGKNELPEGYPGPKQKIKLGLDLQGGIHLVLQVVTEKAVESRLDSTLDQVESLLAEKDVIFKRAERLPQAVVDRLELQFGQETAHFFGESLTTDLMVTAHSLLMLMSVPAVRPF